MFVLLRYLVLLSLALLLISAVVRPLLNRIRATRKEQAPDDSPDFLAALDEEVQRRRGERRDPRPPATNIDQSTIDDTIARFEEEFGSPEEPPAS